MEIEIQEEQFDCQKANSIVTLTNEIAIHRNSARKVDKETLIKFDCSHVDVCGVEKASGLSTTYEWDECLYKKNC